MIDVSIKKKVFDELLVLDNIDFQINNSEFFCILGPSGCGKSTLLRSIGGFESFNGTVSVDSEAVVKPEKDLIMVFQDFSQLFPWLTVMQNITFAIGHVNGKKKGIEDEAIKFLEIVGLKEYADYYPHQLSGGMKQRVAIARSLAVKPKVLLMDEPFASLDAQTRTILQRELLSLWKHFRTTVVFVTHNIQESIILADRIMVMTSGPGTIRSITENTLERPRRPDKPGFTELWHLLYNDLERSKLEEKAMIR